MYTYKNVIYTIFLTNIILIILILAYLQVSFVKLILVTKSNKTTFHLRPMPGKFKLCNSSTCLFRI